MSSSRKIGYVIIGATLGCLGLAATGIQELPRARIGLSGRVEGPVGSPVTVDVRRPDGYGLSAAERRAGWPELNERHSGEVVLDGGPFLVEFPPARYCVHRFLFQSTPPPPASFLLRFSDAPGEEYVVWANEGGSDYRVRDSSGNQLEKTDARWTLDLGSFRSENPGKDDTLWLLDVTFERRESEGAPLEGRSEVTHS